MPFVQKWADRGNVTGRKQPVAKIRRHGDISQLDGTLDRSEFDLAKRGFELASTMLPVSEPMMEDKPVYKKGWVLTGPALEKLLAYLDADPNEAGRKLLDIRKKLQKFFECNRCPDADQLVDVTIDRGARRIDEGVEVRDLPSYLNQVARFVLKEHWVSPQRNMEEIEAEGSGLLLASPNRDQADHEKDELEDRLECLEKCSGKLVPVECQRVIDYYYEQGRAKIDKRKRMAAELKITLGNLRVRMHRTRERLEECIFECLTEKKRI